MFFLAASYSPLYGAGQVSSAGAVATSTGRAGLTASQMSTGAYSVFYIKSCPSSKYVPTATVYNSFGDAAIVVPIQVHQK